MAAHVPAGAGAGPRQPGIPAPRGPPHRRRPGCASSSTSARASRPRATCTRSPRGRLADARVVYVDIDPVAVAESLEILDGQPARHRHPRRSSATRSRSCSHPQVRGLLDFDQPIGLLLFAVLHFVPDDDRPTTSCRGWWPPWRRAATSSISHASADEQELDPHTIDDAQDVYRRRTATPFHLRTRVQVERFFAGLDLVEPGVVWLPRVAPGPRRPDRLRRQPGHQRRSGRCRPDP